MNVTDALEIVLEHCNKTRAIAGTLVSRRLLESAMKRLFRKLGPLQRKRLLRTGVPRNPNIVCPIYRDDLCRFKLLLSPIGSVLTEKKGGR